MDPYLMETLSDTTSLHNPAVRNPKSQRFHDILQELGALHDRKQRDYGRDDDPFANVRASNEWGIEPWVGALVLHTCVECNCKFWLEWCGKQRMVNEWDICYFQCNRCFVLATAQAALPA